MNPWRVRLTGAAVTLLYFTLLAAVSEACSPSLCRPVKIVKAAPVADVFLAPAPVYPAYGSGPSQNQADEVNSELLRQLLEVMRRIEAKLDQQASRPPVTVPPANIDAGKLMGARCATCHTAAVAKSKGGELVLVEDSGKLPPFSVGEQRIIKRAVESGTMPPKASGPALSAAERQSLLDFMFPKPKE